jgi:hypothetical protein
MSDKKDNSNNKHAEDKTMTFIELRKMNTKDLFFKLQQNKGNLKGIKEYLNRFGVSAEKSVKDKKRSTGLTKEEIVHMIGYTEENLDKILGEIERRMKK